MNPAYPCYKNKKEIKNEINYQLVLFKNINEECLNILSVSLSLYVIGCGEAGEGERERDKGRDREV